MPHIEKATLLDVPQLNLLINRSYRGETSKKGWTTEADLLEGSRIDEATLTEYINDDNTFILNYINDSGEIKACVYLNQSSDGLYLGMLTVEPELQAKGIGAKLIARSEAEALQLNYTKLWMTVLSTRSELIAYYQRKGFELTGAKKPFPNDNKFGIAKQPLELLVMEKQLKQFVIV